MKRSAGPGDGHTEPLVADLAPRCCAAVVPSPHPPRRILHVGKYLPPQRGGMETFLHDLLTAQRAQGVNAHAIVHGSPSDDDPPWMRRVPVWGRWLYTPLAPGFGSRLKQAIDELQPDVLHLHLPNVSAFWCLGLPAARRRPWVVHWHSDVVSAPGHRAMALAYHAYRPLEQAVLAQAQRIVVTSPAYLEASEPLARWRERCVVVPLGLAPVGADGEAAPNTSPSIPREGLLPWRPGHLRLLSLGRLAHYKGFETLVAAVAGVPGAQLLIAGEGECRAALEAAVARHFPPGSDARVTLLGAVDETTKQALLQSCDLFCLASRARTEAFGLAVLEAMQHGRACVVSELPGSGLPWLVASSGAGLTVPVDDVVAWGAALARLRDDPAGRSRMGEAGRAAAMQRFGIDGCARALEQVYRQVQDPDTPHAAPPQHAPTGPLMVIPARDEAATVGQVIAALRAAGWHDVLVIDDQSTDDTAAVARAAGARVLRPVLPLGAWGAMQTGLRYALRHGHAQVVTLDADGQHEPACIPLLLEAARHHDVVIGAHPERGSWLRRLAWRYFRWLTGFGMEDLTSGFRCYNRPAIELLAREEATLLDYQDLGVLLMVRDSAMTIGEVPVTMYPRASGASRVFSSWLRVGRYMLESTLLCLARWHPRLPPR